MLLVGHIAGYSIRTEEGDGIPSPSLGFSPAAVGELQWESSAGMMTGPGPRPWFGEEPMSAPSRMAHSRLSLCLPDCGQEQPLQVHRWIRRD